MCVCAFHGKRTRNRRAACAYGSQPVHGHGNRGGARGDPRGPRRAVRLVYFGCTIADNSRIGFRDEIFDNLTGGRENLKGYLEQVDREKCLALFDEYTKTDRTLY